MKNIKLWTIACVTLLMGNSCVNELDNYDAPSGGVYGTFVDTETNQPVPLPVQGATGVIIKLMEENTGATQSVDFYAKHDGTFENSKVFNGSYTITASGAFTNTAEVRTTIKGQTEVNIPVTPFSRIDASASVSGKTVSVQYKATPSNSSYTISEVYGYWNFAPGVDDGGANQAGKVVMTDTEGSFTFDLNNDANYLNNVHKIQSNGNKVYLRVGAKTNSAINYSQVITVSL